jgi:hypothetical protein
MEKLPWDGLDAPASKASFTTKLIDYNNKWDEYWALDYSGNLCLLISCADIDMLSVKLPKLQELDVKLFKQTDGESFLLYLLHDDSYKEVFYEFCLRLVDIAETAVTAEELVKQSLLHTWRWYRFLQGKQSDILKPEEQRGLIGEICFLKNVLATRFSWREALEFWIGPFENPKDFVWGASAVEVKTHLNVARPFIKISSEFQLDYEGFDHFWLATQGFQKVSADDADGSTLADVVNACVDFLSENEPSALESFLIRLSAYGFSFSHDYSDYSWKFEEFKAYDVNSSFPSIQSNALKEGIREVKYRIALSACERYETSIDTIMEILHES